MPLHQNIQRCEHYAFPHQCYVTITRCFCCPQLSEMSSLKSWMQSLLRSLSTEVEARSSLQPGEWCTLLSSWWAYLPPPSLLFSSSSISSPRLSFPPSLSLMFHYLDYSLRFCWCSFFLIVVRYHYSFTILASFLLSFGSFTAPIINPWVNCTWFSHTMFPGFCPPSNVWAPLCRRPLQGWWSPITLWRFRLQRIVFLLYTQFWLGEGWYTVFFLNASLNPARNLCISEYIFFQF